MDNNEFKTWSNIKKELNYKTSLEKEVITETARLVNEIVRRRKETGLSQREVAERAGITQAQVARLETAATVPSIETILKVSLALGLKIEFSLSNEEQSAALAY
ncbi:helix-turn-helix transcriptional regulator [Paenibacillus sp. M1]|uniref:Helix-turn-helix transcriptional regulator n=1 Tax=Paenibacillus haidiansis TaxID=1574488 RepID=A0ABU7VPS9_9BACL